MLKLSINIVTVVTVFLDTDAFSSDGPKHTIRHTGSKLSLSFLARCCYI